MLTWMREHMAVPDTKTVSYVWLRCPKDKLRGARIGETSEESVTMVGSYDNIFIRTTAQRGSRAG